LPVPTSRSCEMHDRTGEAGSEEENQRDGMRTGCENDQNRSKGGQGPAGEKQKQNHLEQDRIVRPQG